MLYLHVGVPVTCVGVGVGVVVVVIVMVMGVFYTISLFLYTINGFVVVFLCGVLLVLVNGVLLFGFGFGMEMLWILL